QSPALLSFLRHFVVQQHPAGDPAHGGAEQSALGAQIPGEQRGLRYSRVLPGFQLQARSAHGSGECLPRMVKTSWSNPHEIMQAYDSVCAMRICDALWCIISLIPIDIGPADLITHIAR